MNDDKPESTPEKSAGKIPLKRLVIFLLMFVSVAVGVDFVLANGDIDYSWIIGGFSGVICWIIFNRRT